MDYGGHISSLGLIQLGVRDMLKEDNPALAEQFMEGRAKRRLGVARGEP